MPALYYRLLRAFQVATIFLHFNPLRLCSAARMLSGAVRLLSRACFVKAQERYRDIDEWVKQRARLAQEEKQRVLLYYNVAEQEPEEVIVFVLGTTYPNLALFDPFPILQHRELAPSSLYRRMVEDNHRNPLFATLGHPTMGMGFLPIPLIDPGEKSVLCARHIATVHDVMAKEQQKRFNLPDDSRCYASFLRANLLSYHARLDDSTALYYHLLQIKKHYGKKVRITLVCHSYGGRVALNLAADIHDGNTDLVIDTVVLIGTPLQEDVIPLLQKTRFKEILCIHSDADTTAYADVFSTGGLPCLGSLSELMADANVRGAQVDEDTLPRMTDVRLCMNGDPTFYDHNGMWALGYPHEERVVLGSYPPTVLLPQIMHLVETYHRLHTGHVHLGLDLLISSSGSLALGVPGDILIYDISEELACLSLVQVAMYDPVSPFIELLAHPTIRNGVIVKLALGV